MPAFLHLLIYNWTFENIHTQIFSERKLYFMLEDFQDALSVNNFWQHAEGFILYIDTYICYLVHDVVLTDDLFFAALRTPFLRNMMAASKTFLRRYMRGNY